MPLYSLFIPESGNMMRRLDSIVSQATHRIKVQYTVHENPEGVNY